MEFKPPKATQEELLATALIQFVSMMLEGL